MNQSKIPRLFLLISTILVLIVILSVSNAYGKDYTYGEMSHILDDDKFFVFNLRFDSLDKKNDLENSEFIFNDKLTVCYLYVIEKNPKDFDIRPLTINILSPSNKIYCGTFVDFGVDYYIVQFPFKLENDSSISLNETGIWWISIEFNKTGSLLTWLYSNPDSKSFNEESNVKLFHGFSINVLNNLEYQQLKAVKSSDIASKALEKSADSAEESSKWTTISTIALFSAAAAAFYHVYILIKHKKEDKEDREKQIEKDEKEKKHERKLKCKLKMVGPMVKLFLINLHIKVWLKEISSRRFKPNDSYKFDELFEKFKLPLDKMIVSEGFIRSYSECREIDQKAEIITSCYKNFVSTTWMKLRVSPAKKDINKAKKEIENIDRLLQDFLELSIV